MKNKPQPTPVLLVDQAELAAWSPATRCAIEALGVAAARARGGGAPPIGAPARPNPGRPLTDGRTDGANAAAGATGLSLPGARR